VFCYLHYVQEHSFLGLPIRKPLQALSHLFLFHRLFLLAV